MIVWSNIILVWTIISLRLTATTRNKEKVWSKFKIASGAEYFVTKTVYSFAKRSQYKWAILFEDVDMNELN